MATRQTFGRTRNKALTERETCTMLASESRELDEVATLTGTSKSDILRRGGIQMARAIKSRLQNQKLRQEQARRDAEQAAK